MSQSPQEGPSSSPNVTQTQTITVEELPPETPVLRLTQQGTGLNRKVSWNEGTVDNEHLNRKKSKCCCVYKKPTQFGESSSESEDECENCYGHVEMKKKLIKKRNPDGTVVDETDTPVEINDGDESKEPDEENPSDSHKPDDSLPGGSK